MANVRRYFFGTSCFFFYSQYIEFFYAVKIVYIIFYTFLGALKLFAGGPKIISPQGASQQRISLIKYRKRQAEVWQNEAEA